MKVFSPANCEELRIPFKRDKIAKVVGRLAQVSPPALLKSLSINSDHPEGENGEASGPENDRIISGVLVQNGFNLTLMAPEDLKEFAGLTTTTITFKKRLVCTAGAELIKWSLEGSFGSITTLSKPKKMEGNGTNGKANGATNGVKKDKEEDEADYEIPRDEVVTYQVMDAVLVEIASSGQVIVQWEGNMINDSIADAVLSVIGSAETSMFGVKKTGSHGHSHYHNPQSISSHVPIKALSREVSHTEKISRLLMLLENHFGTAVNPITGPADVDADTDMDTPANDRPALGGWKKSTDVPTFTPGVEISVPPHTARVWLKDLSVECKNQVLKSRVTALVERASETVAGIGGDY
jgi:cleavage and polyadenylation specificity factor subunit 3